MKSIKKVLALVLAGTMLAGCLVGCGGSADNNSTPLVIATDDMSEKFSEFFAQSVPDQNVADLTAVYLLGNTRDGAIVYDGIDGETHEYNGTEYTYKGISDCVVTENEDGTVDYEFTLREDVKFSDGKNLTADDVIFTFYVFADPTYDGSAALYALPIKGMEEYRSNMTARWNLIFKTEKAGYTANDYYTQAQYDAFWKAFDEAGAAFVEEIVAYCEPYGATTVAEAASLWGFELEADATAADFWAKIVETYGYNLSDKDGIDYESAGSSITSLIAEKCTAVDTDLIAGVQTGESAANITGIQKTGDYSVKITLTEVDATAIYSLALPIQPMHYYGSEELYDYDNNMFGFTKGDLSSVRDKTTTPMGAGPYKFVKYENKIVYLEANENYYKGEPKISNIQIKTTSEADKLPGVVQGTVDIAEPSISKEVATNIQGENSNGELNGDKLSVTLTDYNGYGYIGVNSKNVSVAGDGSSDASKNLRKAIATVLSVYRDVAIDSYYGDAASVINYPISNTSWAAPQKSDADYAIAFSTDVDGNPIYTEGMTEDEKYAAALEAAVGYFKAAGYTFDESGKMTAAPEGAKMSYELMISGGGTGDHPSISIVTNASNALKTIGFELKITDLSDSSILWDGLNAGTVEIWCAAWETSLDPDMFQIYHSQGGDASKYAIYSDYLDGLVMEGRTTTDQSVRKAIYKEALDFVVDYAVEIPVYQRQECSVYSSERVNMETVTKDQTSFYTWMNEIETMEMN